jgi:hypothetical protein
MGEEDDRLHQPVFLGVREDKKASRVVREQATWDHRARLSETILRIPL